MVALQNISLHAQMVGTIEVTADKNPKKKAIVRKWSSLRQLMNRQCVQDSKSAAKGQ